MMVASNRRGSRGAGKGAMNCSWFSPSLLRRVLVRKQRGAVLVPDCHVLKQKLNVI